MQVNRPYRRVVRRPPHGAIVATGVLKNFNTIEEFKSVDKTALFSQEAQLVCDPSIDAVISV